MSTNTRTNGTYTREQIAGWYDRDNGLIDKSIYVDPDIPLPSSVFSRENERAAGKTLRALRTRVAQAPQGST